MQALRSFIPLFIAAGLLLGGNGLFSTLIAVRGAQEGMSAGQIGWMGTTYFLGFIYGCIAVPRLLQQVGHIRTFAALASIASAATIALVLVIDPYVWMASRLIIGICFSGLFTTIESWLNSGVSNSDRGKVTSLYRVMDIAVVSGAQYLMPAFGTDGFTLFGIMAVMITLSLVPVAIGDRSKPSAPESAKFDIPAIWRISPLACAGCVAIGMTNAAFRYIGPLYAESLNLSLSSVATFISLGVVGGAILQYPLGILSDRYDRRWVLIAATLGAVFSGLFISLAAGSNISLVYSGIFLFGAFSLPLYSLSAAHANDRADKGQYIMLAAGLMFFYGIGASIGPPVSSVLLGLYGPESLFMFTSIVHGTFAVITLLRMRQRTSVPVERRGRFRMLIRTSPMMQKLARDRSKHDQ